VATVERFEYLSRVRHEARGAKGFRSLLMIRGFATVGGRLSSVENVIDQLDRVVWIDLINPSDEEEAALEQHLGIDVPTREEMEEIEISSRLYYEDGAAFMTATLPAHADGDDPLMAPVTFVLAGDRLITVRYHEPRAFHTFPTRAEKVAMGCTSGEPVLVALLEAIIDRLADILERAGHDIDRISRGIFQPGGAKPRSRDFQKVLEEIGRKGDLTSNIHDSLVTLERLIGFLGHATGQRKSSKDIRERVKTLARDARSLADHAAFLSQKITFLLDATLGMINIEQSATIKIFSVAAVVFLPPTLVASIYGMNFDHMPELQWLFGYPFAIGLMILSAFVPFWYFKRRGWL
jgi:magnesium transporter